MSDCHSHDHSHDILAFDNVEVRYGQTVALDSLTAHVACNSLTALMGPNGAGKSTMLQAALGWHTLQKGTIHVGDSHAHHALPRLAYLPQRLNVEWDFPITVEEVVTQGRYATLGPFRPYTKEDGEFVASAISEMQLDDLQTRQIRELSGGQQQRVFLARALAQGADIFLLDEPFTGLDMEARDDLVRRLQTWKDQGRTVLASIHDLDLAKSAFSHGILINRKLIACGTAEDVITDDYVPLITNPRGATHE